MTRPRRKPRGRAPWRRAATAGLVVLAGLSVTGANGDPLPRQLHTVAGGGNCAGALSAGGPCDSVAASSVPINRARSVSPLPDGGFLYVDEGDDLIRQVSASGTVRTVAGNGTTTDAADGTVATQSGLNDPVSVAALPAGGFLVTEYGGSVVRVVSAGGPGTATITTIAGTGTAGNNGTSGPATSVELNHPTDAEPTADGQVLIADTYDNAIRLVSAPAAGATLSTLTGPSSACNDVTASCDGSAAGAVLVNHPVSVAPIPGGSGAFLLAEYDAGAIREISALSAQGTFTTVAGTPGHSGYAGDGGPARQALLNHPEHVASTADGGFLIADTANERIRAVSAAGGITTVAGNGQAGSAGDGGAATAGSLMEPAGVAPAADGTLLIADTDNNRIRAVTVPPVTTIALTPAAPDGNNGWYDTPVHVTISAQRATDTRCTADPAAPPTVFDELPDSCPYSGAGADIGASGSHTIYAASTDAAADKELPISAQVKVDATPPTVTCAVAPSFVIDTPGTVTATVADQVSGPVATTVSAPADTAHLGARTASVSGVNNAGGTATARCRYDVVALRFQPAPELSWRFMLHSRPGRARGAYTTVTRLALTRLPKAAAVTVECHGRGCRFTSAHCSTRSCTGAATRTRDLARGLANDRLRSGARLTVIVARARTIGRVWVFTFRPHGQPVVRLTCVAPGSLVVGKGC